MIYQHWLTNVEPWLTNVGNQYWFSFIFPQIFAIVDDFSKWIVPKVINNIIPIEKLSNVAEIWGKNHWLPMLVNQGSTLFNQCW